VVVQVSCKGGGKDVVSLAEEEEEDDDWNVVESDQALGEEHSVTALPDADDNSAAQGVWIPMYILKSVTG